MVMMKMMMLMIIIIIISYRIKANSIFMIAFLMKENKVNERKFYKQ